MGGVLLRSLLAQVKKLVYVYLVRYAEEQQDLALLSISTFQRGLKVSCPPARLPWLPWPPWPPCGRRSPGRGLCAALGLEAPPRLPRAGGQGQRRGPVLTGS